MYHKSNSLYRKSLLLNVRYAELALLYASSVGMSRCSSLAWSNWLRMWRAISIGESSIFTRMTREDASLSSSVSHSHC